MTNLYIFHIGQNGSDFKVLSSDENFLSQGSMGKSESKLTTEDIIFLEKTTDMSAEELKIWHNDFILISDNGKLNQKKFLEAFVQLGGWFIFKPNVCFQSVDIVFFFSQGRKQMKKWSKVFFGLMMLTTMDQSASGE